MVLSSGYHFVVDPDAGEYCGRCGRRLEVQYNNYLGKFVKDHSCGGMTVFEFFKVIFCTLAVLFFGVLVLFAKAWLRLFKRR